MAKIRLINNDTWKEFHRVADDLKISNDELLGNFLNAIPIVFTPEEEESGDARASKEGLLHEKITTLESVISKFRTEIEQYDKDLIWRRDQIKELEVKEAKQTKRLTSQKDTILKKNETLREVRAKLSVYRRENKKLGKQIKALTVVEDEEDGDSESTI